MNILLTQHGLLCSKYWLSWEKPFNLWNGTEIVNLFIVLWIAPLFFFFNLLRYQLSTTLRPWSSCRIDIVTAVASHIICFMIKYFTASKFLFCTLVRELPTWSQKVWQNRELCQVIARIMKLIQKSLRGYLNQFWNFE